MGVPTWSPNDSTIRQHRSRSGRVVSRPNGSAVVHRRWYGDHQRDVPGRRTGLTYTCSGHADTLILSSDLTIGASGYVAVGMRKSGMGPRQFTIWDCSETVMDLGSRHILSTAARYHTGYFNTVYEPLNAIGEAARVLRLCTG